MQKFSTTGLFLTDVHKNYHRLQAFLRHIALGSVLVAGSVVVSLAQAEPPDVAGIVARMKAVFEPARPSIRKVSISVSGDEGANNALWVVGEARKKFTDGKRTLFVILEPHSLRGSAFLFWEQREQEDRLWTYFPELGGMRGIIGVDAYDHFLHTDFTYADLGLVRRPGRYRLLGEEEHGGTRAYKIDEAPKERWYYSRVVTWIDTESLLPLERNLYDQAGRLWKRILFDHVTPINGIPTPLRIRMVDVQREGSTELLMSGVRYDVELPDELFDPDGLPQVIASPLWDPFPPHAPRTTEPLVRQGSGAVRSPLGNVPFHIDGTHDVESESIARPCFPHKSSRTLRDPHESHPKAFKNQGIKSRALQGTGLALIDLL